jgi:restriction endonuclease Mrr
MLITTAGFTKSALEEATTAAKAPISLVDGPRLVELMIDLKIGVEATPVTVYTLAPLPTFG